MSALQIIGKVAMVLFACVGIYIVGYVTGQNSTENKYHELQDMFIRLLDDIEAWLNKDIEAPKAKGTVDAVAVVRCKDCVKCGFCGDATNLEVMGLYGFCSRGKRPEDI